MMFGGKTNMHDNTKRFVLFHAKQLQVYKMKEKKEIDVLCFTHVPCEIHSTANTYSIVSGNYINKCRSLCEVHVSGRYIIICITMYVLIFSLQACIVQN